MPGARRTSDYVDANAVVANIGCRPRWSHTHTPPRFAAKLSTLAERYPIADNRCCVVGGGFVGSGASGGRTSVDVVGADGDARVS